MYNVINIDIYNKYYDMKIVIWGETHLNKHFINIINLKIGKKREIPDFINKSCELSHKCEWNFFTCIDKSPKKIKCIAFSKSYKNIQRHMK